MDDVGFCDCTFVCCAVRQFHADIRERMKHTFHAVHDDGYELLPLTEIGEGQSDFFDNDSIMSVSSKGVLLFPIKRVFGLRLNQGTLPGF